MDESVRFVAVVYVRLLWFVGSVCDALGMAPSTFPAFTAPLLVAAAALTVKEVYEYLAMTGAPFDARTLAAVLAFVSAALVEIVLRMLLRCATTRYASRGPTRSSRRRSR